MSPTMLQSVQQFFAPFEEQSNAIAQAMIAAAKSFPIACVALYGSVLTGVGPHSDVDVLVLIRNDYREKGFDFLDLRLDLEDIAEEARMNDIPVDLHVSIARDFLDVSRDTHFKRSFSENNLVIWEDGVTIEPYLVDIP